MIEIDVPDIQPFIEVRKFATVRRSLQSEKNDGGVPRPMERVALIPFWSLICNRTRSHL